MMHAAQQPLAARAVHLWAAVPLPAALGWHSKAPRKAQSMAAHQIPTVCSYSIRAIASSDIPRLAEIEQQCKEFSACWSGADIAAELDNSLSRAAVAADDSTDEALGYIVCWLVAGELQVRALCAAACDALETAQPGALPAGALTFFGLATQQGYRTEYILWPAEAVRQGAYRVQLPSEPQRQQQRQLLKQLCLCSAAGA